MQPKIDKVEEGLYKKQKAPAEEEARHERIEEGAYEHQFDNSDPHGPDMSISNSLRVGSAGTPTHTLDIDGDAEILGNLYVRGDFQVVETATAYDIDLLTMGDYGAINTIEEDIIKIFGETTIQGSLLDVEMVEVDIDGTTAIRIDSPDMDITVPDFDIVSDTELQITSPLMDVDATDYTIDGDNLLITEAVKVQTVTPLIDENATNQYIINTPNFDINADDFDIVSSSEYNLTTPKLTINVSDDMDVDVIDTMRLHSTDQIFIDADVELQVDTALYDINAVDKMEITTKDFDIDVDGPMTIDVTGVSNDFTMNVQDVATFHSYNQLVLDGDNEIEMRTDYMDIDINGNMEVDVYGTGSDYTLNVNDVMLLHSFNQITLEADTKILVESPNLDVDIDTIATIDVPQADITVPDLNIVSSIEMSVNTPLHTVDATTKATLTTPNWDVNVSGPATLDVTGAGNDWTVNIEDLMMLHSSNQITLDADSKLLVETPNLDVDIDTIATINSPQADITVPDLNIVSSIEMSVNTPLHTVDATTKATLTTPRWDVDVSGPASIDVTGAGNDLSINVQDVATFHSSNQVIIDGDNQIDLVSPVIELEASTLTQIDTGNLDLNVTGPATLDVTGAGNDLTVNVADLMMLHSSNQITLDADSKLLVETPNLDVDIDTIATINAPQADITVPDLNIVSSTEMSLNTPLYTVDATSKAILNTPDWDVNVSGPATLDITGSGNDWTVNVADLMMLHSSNQITLDADNKLLVETPIADWDISNDMTIDVVDDMSVNVGDELLLHSSDRIDIDGDNLIQATTINLDIDVSNDYDLDVSNNYNLDVLNNMTANVSDTMTLHSSDQIILNADVELEATTPLFDLNSTTLDIDGTTMNADFTNATLHALTKVSILGDSEVLLETPLFDLNSTTLDIDGTTMNVDYTDMTLHATNKLNIDGDVELELTTILLDIDVSDDMTLDVVNNMTINTDTMKLHSIDKITIDGDAEVQIETPWLNLDSTTLDIDGTTFNADFANTTLHTTSKTIINADSELEVQTPLYDINSISTTINGNSLVITEAVQVQINVPQVDINSSDDVNIDATDEINIHAQDDILIQADDVLTLQSGTATSTFVMNNTDATLTLPNNTSKFLITTGTSPDFGDVEIQGNLTVRGDLNVVDSATSYTIDQLNFGDQAQYSGAGSDIINMYGFLNVKSQSINIDADQGVGLINMHATSKYHVNSPFSHFTGQVGINTGAIFSTTYLHIYDNRSGSIQGQRLTIAPSASTSDIDFGMYIDATSDNVAGTSARGLFNIDINGANNSAYIMHLRYNDSVNTALAVHGDGGVSIGTDDNHDKELYVDGDIQLTGTFFGVAVTSTISSPEDMILTIDNDDNETTRRFAVRHDDATSLAKELFTVMETGVIGIGTTDPATTLHIMDTVPELRLEDSDHGGIAGVQASSGNLEFYADDGATEASTYIAFQIDNSEKVRFNAAGHVGIGTNPGEKFHTFLTQTETAKIQTNNGRNSAMLNLINTGTAGGNANVDHGLVVDIVGNTANANLLNLKTQSATKVIVKETGKVGIGTNDPTHMLDVAQSGAGFIAEFINTDTNGGIRFKVNDATDTLGMGANHRHAIWGSTSESLAFVANNEQALAINNLGDLIFTDPGSAHGMTTISETNAYATIKESADGNGGGEYYGFSFNAGTVPARFHGIFGVTDPTDSIPAVLFMAGKKNSTSWQALTANETAYQFKNYSTALATILGSGNVGVGTNVPSELLEISSSAVGKATIDLTSRNSTGGMHGGLVWRGYYNATSTPFDAVGIKRNNINDNNGTDNKQRLSFMVREPIVGGALKEMMSIRENGNVGIGVTDPSNPLVIAGPGFADGEVANLQVYNNGNSILWGHQNPAYDNAIGAFGTDGHPFISFFSYHAAGVNTFKRSGTTPPGRWLYNSNGLLVFQSASAGTADTDIGTWTTRFAIENGGNVGIGTGDPEQLLHLDSANARMRIEGTTGHNFDIGYDGNYYSLDMLSAARKIALKQGGQADLVLDINHRVGIGTTSPDRKLQVSDTVDNQLQLSYGTTSRANFGVRSDKKLQIWVHDGTSYQDILLGIDGTAIAGNVGIATTVAREKLSVHGTIGVGYNTAMNIASSGYINLKLGNFRGTPTNATDCFIGAQDTGGPGQSAGDLILMSRSSVNASIRMYTGSTTPKERLSVLGSNGYVGIGTGDPIHLLEVESATNSPAQTLLALTTKNNGSNNDSIAIDFRTNMALDGVERVSSRIESIQTKVTSSHYGELAFSTLQTGTLSEKMRINSAGNVGIGTTDPAAMLTIGEPPTTEASIRTTVRGAGGESGGIEFYDSNSGPTLVGRMSPYVRGLTDGSENVDLRFATIGAGSFATRMTIYGDGHVGIGITNPGAKLDVVESKAGVVATRIMNTSTNIASVAQLQLIANGNNFQIQSYNDAHATYPEMTRIYTTSVGASLSMDMGTPGEGIFVKDGGYVGIGNTDPSVPLEVRSAYTMPTVEAGTKIGVSASGPARIAIIAGTNQVSYLDLGDGADQDVGGISYSHVLNKMAFRTNAGDNKMVIDSSGQVGIGVPTPGYPLDVLDGIRISRTSTYNSHWDMTISHTGSSNYGTIIFKPSINTGDFNVTNSAGASKFYIDTSSGNIGIGTAEPSVNLEVAGQVKINTSTSLPFEITGETTGNAYMKISNSGNNTLMGIDSSAGGSLVVGGLPYATVLMTQSARPLQLGTSNNARLTIDSLGKVGIGITNPDEALHVVGNIKLSGTIIGGIATPSVSDTDDVFITIDSNNNSTTNRFGIRHDTGGAANELFTVKESGNVGIGSTNPSERLVVSVDTDISAEIGRAHIGYDGTNGNYAIFSHIDRNSQSDFALKQGNNGDTWLNTGGGTQVRLTSNGAAGVQFLTATQTAFVGSVVINETGNDIDFRVESDSDGHAFFVDATDGKIGVGTAVPGETMHIYRATNYGSIQLEGDEARVRLKGDRATGGASASNWTIATELNGYNGVMPLIFKEDSGIEAMRMMSNGHIGIGTANPTAELHMHRFNTRTNLLMSVFSNTLGDIPEITLRKSGGSGIDDPLEVGDQIGELNWYGSNNTATPTMAGKIKMVAAHTGGTWTTGSNRLADMVFEVADDPIREAMRLTANGDVGIGTYEPDLTSNSQFPRLHVSHNKFLAEANSYDAHLIISDSRTASSGNSYNDQRQAGLNFAINANGSNPGSLVSIAAVRGGKDSPNNNDQRGFLSFHTMNHNGTAWGMYEHMRITKEGYVGVGTIEPTNRKLYVYETQQNQIADVPLVEFHTGGSASSTKGGILHLTTTRGGGTVDTDLFKVSNATDTFLTVRNNGYIGINTTTPGQRLSVEGAGTANESVLRVNNQGNFASRIWLRQSSRSAYFSVSGSAGDDNATGILPYGLSMGLSGSVSPIQFWNGTTPSVKMTILANGLVGIGTANPTSQLQVQNISATTPNLYIGGPSPTVAGTDPHTVQFARGSGAHKGSGLNISGSNHTNGTNTNAAFVELNANGYGGANTRYIHCYDNSSTDFEVFGDGNGYFGGSLTVNGGYIRGNSDDTSTLGTADNRWATLYMASAIDYATTLNFNSGGTKMSLDTSGKLTVQGDLEVVGTITGTLVANEQIEDVIGAMVDAGGTESGVSVTYTDNGAGAGALNFTVNDSHAQTWASISSKPDTATRWPAYTEVTDVPTTFAPSAHNQNWTTIDGKPDTATRWPAYTEVTDVPTTFAPSAHGHAWADITGEPATYAPSAHGHAWADITGEPATYAPSAHNQNWTTIDGKPDTATRWPAYTEVTDVPTTFAPSAHGHAWADITGEPATYAPSAHNQNWTTIDGKPDTATRWPAYTEVTGVPTTFAPSAHSHAWADVTGEPDYTTRWPTYTEVTGKPSTFAPSAHDHSKLEASDGSPDPALSVDAAGDIGIGTADASASLDVVRGGVRVALRSYENNSNENSWLAFYKSHTDTLGSLATTQNNEALGTISFLGVDTLPQWEHAARIRVFQDGAAGGRVPARMYFSTQDGSSENTNLSIKANGNVGIGTTNPLTKFDVVSSTDPDLTIRRRGASSGNAISLSFVEGDGVPSNSSALARIRAFHTGGSPSGDLRFYTNEDGSLYQRMEIDDSGYVGIHTDANSSLGRLHVNGTISSSSSLYARGDGAKTYYGDGTDVYVGENSSKSGQLDLYGDESVKVLLGTYESPYYGYTYSAKMRIECVNNAYQAALYVGQSSGSGGAYLKVYGNASINGTIYAYSDYNGDDTVKVTMPSNVAQGSIAIHGINIADQANGDGIGVKGEGGYVGVYGIANSSDYYSPTVGVYGEANYDWYDSYYGKWQGQYYGDFYAGGTGTYAPFTGSHQSTLKSDFGDYDPGMIVSTTGNVVKKGVSSTFPEIGLSNIANDKKVFGVIVSSFVFSHNPENEFGRLGVEFNGKNVASVNSVGEGQVWVTNYNGDIENGDYVTSSPIAGYGQLQSDDLQHNYTVAKITQDIDWNSVTETIEYESTQYKKKLVTCTYHCG